MTSSEPAFPSYFDLADLQGIPPDLLRPRSELDKCLLALALLFNDLRDLGMVFALLEPHKHVEIPSTRAGQWIGATNHFMRLAVGLLSEFLTLLEKKRPLIEGDDFKRLLSRTPRTTQRACGLP